MTGFNCGSSATPSGFSAVADEQLDQIEGGIAFIIGAAVGACIVAGAAYIASKVRDSGDGGGGVPQDLINFAASGGTVRPPA